MSSECNANVFKNGHGICALDACMHRAETWVQAVAAESGQTVDWHYSGGRVNVLYLGDYAKVLAAVEKLEPSLASPLPREKGECGSCDGATHRLGVMGRVSGAGERGLYRAGDWVPPGTIGVV